MREDVFLLFLFVAGWLALLGAATLLAAALSWLGARLQGQRDGKVWAARLMERGWP